MDNIYSVLLLLLIQLSILSMMILFYVLNNVLHKTLLLYPSCIRQSQDAPVSYNIISRLAVFNPLDNAHSNWKWRVIEINNQTIQKIGSYRPNLSFLGLDRDTLKERQKLEKVKMRFSGKESLGHRFLIADLINNNSLPISIAVAAAVLLMCAVFAFLSFDLFEDDLNLWQSPALMLLLISSCLIGLALFMGQMPIRKTLYCVRKLHDLKLIPKLDPYDSLPPSAMSLAKLKLFDPKVNRPLKNIVNKKNSESVVMLATEPEPVTADNAERTMSNNMQQTTDIEPTDDTATSSISSALSTISARLETFKASLKVIGTLGASISQSLKNIKLKR